MRVSTSSEMYRDRYMTVVEGLEIPTITAVLYFDTLILVHN